jgi:chemotaxis protein methyltransferase CheR
MSPAGDPAASQVERFRTSIVRRLGLRFDDARLASLAELLSRRADRSTTSVESYLGGLEAGPSSRAELRTLAEELTVTETYFFRNVEQFHALRELVLPARARARSEAAPAGSRRLRILSAGCASGEEVYSLAILIRDQPELVGFEVDVLGIDVNPAALARAARGRYAAWSFRETPADVQERCFQRDGRELVISSALRTSVRFSERNLLDPDTAFWQPAVFDVVLCRNVIMYFPVELQRAVIERLTASLVPGGYLFLGHAETMRGLSPDHHLRHTHGTFYYQRREIGEPREESGPWGEAAGWTGSAPPALMSSPAPSPSASVPGLAEDSWVDAIRRASERIAALASGRGAEEATSSSSSFSTPSWTLAATVELMRQERFDEARAALTAAPAGAAETADALLLRAVLLTHGGDLAAAEEVCARVLALDELSAGAHYLSALCREHDGDRRGALEHDRVAAYLDPSFAMPRLHLGLLARRAGQPEVARRALKEALDLLEREDPSRLLLFAGGFGRDALITLCRAELASCGAAGT